MTIYYGTQDAYQGGHPAYPAEEKAQYAADDLPKRKMPKQKESDSYKETRDDSMGKHAASVTGATHIASEKIGSQNIHHLSHKDPRAAAERLLGHFHQNKSGPHQIQYPGITQRMHGPWAITGAEPAAGPVHHFHFQAGE